MRSGTRILFSLLSPFRVATTPALSTASLDRSLTLAARCWGGSQDIKGAALG